MKESVAIAKDAAAKKEFSHTMSDNSIQHLRNEPERQLGSLRDVIDNIRSDGGTLSVDRITTELSSMHTAERAPVLMALQRMHGNRYVQRVVAGIQAKLKVGQPGDVYEQEADRVAEQVMRMPEPEVQRQPEEEENKEKKSILTKPIADQITPMVQRQIEEEEEKKEERGEEEKVLVMTKSLSGEAPQISDDFEEGLSRTKGLGGPLPADTRTFMEERFGADFSAVGIHTDSETSLMARALNAEAFTHGRDIYFGAGKYSPGTLAGKRLLAHELTHVMQQTDSQRVTISIQRNPEESESPPEEGSCLPPDSIENFCQPYSSRQEARRIRSCILRSFVPILSSAFGSEVGALWRSYLNRRHGASLRRRTFSSPSSQIVQGFVASQTTNRRVRVLLNTIKQSFRSSCPQLQANQYVDFPISRFLTREDLQYPINYSEPLSIPGHIAGGVGSSDAGPDLRRVSGTVSFLRSTDGSGRTTGISLVTDFNFAVRDAIDFCPGQPGGETEQVLTIPLSRLETTGLFLQDEPFAYDLPFEVRFTVTPPEEDLDFSFIRACYLDAVRPGAEAPPPQPEPEPEEPEEERRELW